MRRATMTVVATAVLGLLAGGACRDAAGPDRKPSASLGLLTGDVTAVTATSGSSLDPDGYTITLDLLQTKSVGTNGSVTFSASRSGRTWWRSAVWRGTAR
ncbi:MAG TPA: hypothetical protein VFI66_00220 [Gemmatimonadales bacterium]|nr:hypothetical protein [Gemmatimonadales bacterium]